ncbi:uncharacterized protein LOC109047519 isoform X3 [Cyprinus carpio]|uniref:Uncharacterized protein LOC109047519 isoform X3 n=1 Tax=Cyprinus carpio TaxID=7962 RepID=A0A9R0AXJ7_CYPCA|nr:uncharacterized protein LOC109047519 isoform X3 [Cyprinus carpio]
MSSHLCALILFVLCGVFGDTDLMKSVSVTEGDSVTLNTDVTEVQRDDQILWMFGPKETRIVEIYKHIIDMFNSNEIFGDRLQMDSFTGSLTIRNIRRTDSGLYKRQIRSNRGSSDKTFSVTVYDSVQFCGSTEAVIRLVVSALVGVAAVAAAVYDFRSGRAQ